MIYLFDLGGTSIKGLKLSDEKKELKEYHIFYQERVNTYNVDLKHALNLIKKIVKEENEINVKIGMSIPGAHDFEQQKILTNSTFVNVHFDVAGYLMELDNVKKVVFNNDGKCATMGEWKFGQQEKIKNMVLMTIGTSIGGGLVLNGQIYEGIHNQALAIDRFLNNLDAEMNDIRQANEFGTVRNIYHYTKIKGLDMRTFGGKEFVMALEAKEPEALKIFDKWTTGLAKLIVNTQLVIDIEAYFIGGGISGYQPFIDKVAKKVATLCQQIQLVSPVVKKANLENKAGCYGALEFLEMKK